MDTGEIESDYVVATYTLVVGFYIDKSEAGISTSTYG